MTLTPEQIDALPAGREMDAAVAVLVMGGKRLTYEEAEGQTGDKRMDPYWHFADATKEYAEDMSDWGCPDTTWEPSFDIAAAWQVLEHFGCYFQVVNTPKEDRPENYVAAIVCGNRTSEAWGNTAPLAICRAALKAIMATP